MRNFAFYTNKTKTWILFNKNNNWKSSGGQSEHKGCLFLWTKKKKGIEKIKKK